MNKLKLFETKKLHYGKYLYKLSLHNAFAPSFRTEFQKHNKLSLARKKLDETQELYDKGEPLYRTVFRSQVPIDPEEFLDAKRLYEHLMDNDDYKIRVERYNGLCLYSNDKDFLIDLSDKLSYSARQFWEPNTDNIEYLLTEENVVIVDKEPEFQYKVTFNAKNVNSGFGKWLEANTDKSRVGRYTLENIFNGYANNSYIYIRDKKVLTMIEIIVGHNIRKVEELIYKPNIDK